MFKWFMMNSNSDASKRNVFSKSYQYSYKEEFICFLYARAIMYVVLRYIF